MVAVLTLLTLLAVALIVTRVATVLLMATGLSRSYARFQARSAYTGVGYTTSESEAVVNHPVRRRVVAVLMLLGNLGIASVVAAIILSYNNVGATGAALRTMALVGGLVLLTLLAWNTRFDQILVRLTSRVVGRWTDLDVRDWVGLLRLGSDYAVVEMAIEEGDWVAGASLADTRLRDEGIVVLGVECDGRYLGTPDGATVVQPGDVLLLYGRGEALAELDERRAGPSGDQAHAEGVEDHEEAAVSERDALDGDSDAGQS